MSEQWTWRDDLAFTIHTIMNTHGGPISTSEIIRKVEGATGKVYAPKTIHRIARRGCRAWAWAGGAEWVYGTTSVDAWRRYLPFWDGKE